MPGRGDGQAGGGAALAGEPPHRLRERRRAPLGDEVEQRIRAGILRHGRGRRHVGRRERRRVVAFVEREQPEILRELAGIEAAGQGLQIDQRIGGGPRDPGPRQIGLDLVAARRVGIEPDRDRPRRLLEGAAQAARGAERPGGDEDLRVPGPPIRQRRRDDRGERVARLLDQHGPRAWKEADRLDRVRECRRVAAQIGGRDPGKPHLRRAIRADDRLDEPGAPEADARRVAIEQHARRRPVRGVEIARRLPARELHGDGAGVAIGSIPIGPAVPAADGATGACAAWGRRLPAVTASSSRIWSASVRASRRSASCSADRLAKAEAFSDCGAL